MYRCNVCGYKGDRFIYQFTDYTCCVASNPKGDETPEYIKPAPEWVTAGSAEIGEPVGCPECHAWGIWEIIEEVKP